MTSGAFNFLQSNRNWLIEALNQFWFTPSVTYQKREATIAGDLSAGKAGIPPARRVFSDRC